ncbi:hypothetical protein [Burkholderia cenocepacia]|uniref:hypothetical protein n=1 Tax=Burkholderia cenocepacia TaxID=95486 RepID=UPI0007617A53|nr:hypothetical protein [Burkholderia cenocepacia]KWU23407.1 hypothetical protein AS149_37090 [Burkholderia cenocepacia]
MESNTFECIRDAVSERQLKSLVFSMRKHLTQHGVQVSHSLMLDAMAAGLGKDAWRAVKAAFESSDPHLAEAREILRGEDVWVYYEVTSVGGWSRTMPAWVRLKMTPTLLARIRQLIDDMKANKVSETVLDEGFECVWDEADDLHFLYEELVVTPRTIFLRMYQQDCPEGHSETIGRMHDEQLAAFEARKSGEPVFFVDNPELIVDAGLR